MQLQQALFLSGILNREKSTESAHPLVFKFLQAKLGVRQIMFTTTLYLVKMEI